MSIEGLWKISEINALDSDFNQAWRSAEGLDADEGVSPMQKAMARSMFLFEQGGRYLQLLPKDLGPGEVYDDDHVIGRVGSWKTEDGKVFVDTEENGAQVWSEAVPFGDGFEVFGFFRLVRA
ncbi:MAG: hypothetical protein IKP18_00495 [Candidatus Methanomethylophilaceae archaeon]|nr:hypothetical protein [Candidatus Methanomethylophilaceae archaeon]